MESERRKSSRQRARLMRTKLLVASTVASVALLIFAASYASDDVKLASYLPKEGEVVAVRSLYTGKFLEVSPHDGRLRATATVATNRTALFRVMLLSTPMVHILVDSMRTANNAEWSKRRHWTGVPPSVNSSADAGCQCTGFSNDHGFGAYCYGWEYEAQVPWCYVSDTCTAQNTSGSFGRKYAECIALEDGLRPLTPIDEDNNDFDMTRRPEWDHSVEYGIPEGDGTQIGDEDYNPDYSAWDNQSATWDETANFTGMDEYWAGRRSWDEGEEDPWWASSAEEGDEYGWTWMDEANYTGCNCPAFCVSNGKRAANPADLLLPMPTCIKSMRACRLSRLRLCRLDLFR